MPGCSLYVSADVFTPLTATAGIATWTLAIPSDPANLLGVTASNAGELQIGGRSAQRLDGRPPAPRQPVALANVMRPHPVARRS